MQAYKKAIRFYFSAQLKEKESQHFSLIYNLVSNVSVSFILHIY